MTDELVNKNRLKSQGIKKKNRSINETKSN